MFWLEDKQDSIGWVILYIIRTIIRHQNGRVCVN